MDICGYPTLNTKLEAERSERARIQQVFEEFHNPPIEKKEVPTLKDWFNGRYWDEWVVGMNRKPGTADENKRMFEARLDEVFGPFRLDEISVEAIAQYRAKLVKEVKPKTVNNILNVLSKPLRYAEAVGVIDRALRIGLLRAERPEIECWSIDEYPLIIWAAAEEGPEWRVAALLAGEAGLRIGEVRGLRIEEELDLAARTITVNQQTRHGVSGLPKGGTRRTIPMTSTLFAALSAHTKGRDGMATLWQTTTVRRRPTGRRAGRSSASTLARTSAPNTTRSR